MNYQNLGSESAIAMRIKIFDCYPLAYLLCVREGYNAGGCASGALCGIPPGRPPLRGGLQLQDSTDMRVPGHFCHLR